MATKTKKTKSETSHLTVGLSDARHAPRKLRAKKAVSILKKTLTKHFRKETPNIVVSEKINTVIWKNSAAHPPVKIKLVVLLEKEKIRAFLDDGKDLASYQKEITEKEKHAKRAQTEEKAREKTLEGKAETAEEAEKQKEAEEKLAEKKAKEEAADF